MRAAADAPSATTSAELARSGPVPAGTYALGAAVLILTGAILTAAAGQRSRRRAASVRAV
jgi:hypothetical protein